MNRTIKTATLLAVSLIFLLVAGCASSIKPNEYQDAEKICAPNDGVERIFVMEGTLVYHCNNGVEYSYSRPSN